MTEHKKSKKSVPSAVEVEDFSIKPEKGLPAMDTTAWPLLLKVNYYS
jgi:hypothetical protein